MKANSPGGFLACGLVCVLAASAFIPRSDFESRSADPALGRVRRPRIDSALPSTSYRYRGVVTGNIDVDDSGDELMVDFGRQGVWLLRNPGEPWSQKAPDNPEWIIGLDLDGNGDLEIAGNFAAKGLWFFDDDLGGGRWHLLTSDAAEGALAVDDDGDGSDELHVDFGNLGLWRYDGDSRTWRRFTTDNPSGGIASAFRQTWMGESIWDFESQGLWMIRGSDPPLLMNPKNPSGEWTAGDLGLGGPEDELVVDFGVGMLVGLWICQSSGGTETWTQITGNHALNVGRVRFVGDFGYELYAAFWGYPGLWIWDCTGSLPGTWTRLFPWPLPWHAFADTDFPTWNEAFCEPFDPDGTSELTGDEELAVDWGWRGLWLYDSSVLADNMSPLPWTLLTTASPRFMVRADLGGHGLDNCLVCDFEALGLWYYDGQANIWRWLTGDSPDP